MNSRLSGFHRFSVEERLQIISEACHLTEEDKEILIGKQPLSISTADAMIENVLGSISIPVGVATNFKINGKDTFIPMATEEPSVVAAASNAAKASYDKGGFFASLSGSVMIGQIQVIGVEDPYAARLRVYDKKSEILKICNEKDPTLVAIGGGAIDIEVKIIQTVNEVLLVVHLLVDTKDAMGANAVNTMAESIAPLIENITSGKALLRIISNLADRRLARAHAVFSKDQLGGEEVVRKIVNAYEFADADPYRAATHNKGIMNGISAVVLATGNDTRAVEAGAHAFATVTGQYRSLTKWEENRAGDLVGSIELPMPVGIIGGATKTHPVAKVNLKILGIQSAEELACCIASVGLAQNLAAMRALATDGIQKGHMALHAKNLAVMAGATGDEIGRVVAEAVKEKDVRFDRILQLTKEIQGRI
ncbi:MULTISPECIES: hydroxymethylglutaryl-CoA reductase, degradative [Cytobacillus]|uniref:hydroxymethylglutaryl-CoA reductase, degradative n=1 Tax=Cytobacillus TaxID=2675230 RepID=UPI001CD60CD5|nr:hydroxymethylglutaryl-CoA reductase, degradative [Cytobacillus kochii]MCA1029001.1 hydroxymethylglutaryl-CoA reductase, degradative [Cytobacillus kochii]MCM3324429.1 hydroxymethylglutaryl-CoA reductase, degradative [Cytobacillus kochii]MCM3346822.1 hydroxymethylglutaryl-CoA reductase, degradative [Cytobacillus kochii]MDM5206024.1 hydroxymethylglutaryl-CoA reductase, degradative [Cytobacillus kochii]